MATETEIERLVVRLVGDDSGYRAMMQGAAEASGEFSRVGGEVERTQRDVQESTSDTTDIMNQSRSSTMGTSRGFRFLGMEITQAGMAVSAFNGPLGMGIASLGGMTASVGTAMHGVRALGTSINSVKGILAGNPFAFAAGGAALAGITAITIAYRLAAKEMGNAVEESERLYNITAKFQSEDRSKEFRERQKSPLVSPGQDLGISASAAEFNREKQTSKVVLSQLEEGSKRYKSQFERLTNERNKEQAWLIEYKNTFWTKKALSFLGDTIDKSGHEQKAKEASDQAEAARLEMNKYNDAIDKNKEAFAELENEHKRSRLRGIADDITNLRGQFEQLTMTEKNAARAAFRRKHDVDSLPVPVQTITMGIFDAMAKVTANAKVQKEVRAMSDALADMLGKDKEILQPLNSQLRVTNELEKANRDYARAHNMAVANVPQSVQNYHRLTAVLREHQRQLQEGQQIYEQYKDPLDRVIDSQTKLKQAHEETIRTMKLQGTTQEQITARTKAYERATAAAYGEAHKLWQEQFKGQQYDALVGGTSAATRALYEYKLGSTPIPLESKDMVQKPWTTEDSAKREEKLLVPVNRMANGIDILVTQGKDKKPADIPTANF